MALVANPGKKYFENDKVKRSHLPSTTDRVAFAVGNSSVPSRAVDEEANDKGVSDPDLWHGRRQGQDRKLRRCLFH